VRHPHPDMTPPPPLAGGTLRITPLGGLGEVGRNMTVMELDGSLLVVDCGVLFPDDNHPGVDLILPDLDVIRDRLDDVVALVLTHGHADHIGAVPFLLHLRPDIPLVGSELTLAFVEEKLKEHRIPPYSLRGEEGQVEKLGPFECEFGAVNHSIPDALAVMIRSAAGTVLHTGDFKMDQLPLDGRLTDLRAFARFGEEGVDLFMVDSTNAEVPGFTPLEREIGPVLDTVFAQSAGKIVVASFASNVHRVQQVLTAAARHGRKVGLVGRSMVRNMGLAAELGYLDVPEGVLVDAKALTELPDDEVVLVATGSQGEPMSALSRMANKDHTIPVSPGDTVIFASSLIPGNENSVYRVINGLTRLGARVVHQGNARVHVSGHASAGELMYVYNVVQPRNVMPIHGEIRHLVANGAIAVQTGVPPERVMLAEDGVVVDLVDGVARIVGAVPCRYIYVDGASVGEITDSDLKDRRILGVEGFISIFAALDSATGEIVTGPHVQARGLAEPDEVFDPIRGDLRAALEEAARDSADVHELQQVMRRVVGRFASQKLRRRPMIVPLVIEV